MSRRAPLPRGVDELPSGKFRVRVAGFPSRSFTERRDAEDHLATLRRAKETGRLDSVDADLQTLRDLATEHMTAEAANLSEATRKLYGWLWKANVRTHHMADMPLRMLSPKVIEDFRDDLLAAKVGEESVRKTLTLLHTVIERGVRHGKIPYNPVKAVKKPSGKRRKTVTALSPTQIEAARREAKQPDAVLIALLAYTGMRPGEARALTWGDVGVKTINIDKAASPSGAIKATKNRKNRSVPLIAPLRDDLTAFRVASGNPPARALIFPKSDGTAWTKPDYDNWRKRKFQKATGAAGIDVTDPYTLRHSAASLWLHEGLSAVQVAQWMGHSISMTQDTYGQVIGDLDPADRRPAVDMILAARDKPMTSLHVVRGQKQSTSTASAARRPRRRRPATA